MIQIDRAQALAFRLAGQHLDQRLPAGSLIEASAVCAVQNTPPGSAALALHARVSSLGPGDLPRLVEQHKTLLQAWSMRAAPCVFPTSAAAVFTRGLLPESETGLRAFMLGAVTGLDTLGMSAVELVRRTTAGLRELLDGCQMTKEELGLSISGWIGPTLPPAQREGWKGPSPLVNGQTLGETLVRFALPVTALAGECCHGPRRGNQAFLVLVDQWLGQPLPIVPPAQARAELLRRYLQAYGPSKPAHYAEWAGIALSQAKETWQLLDEELAHVMLEGHPAWLLEHNLPQLTSPPKSSGVRFLPAYDPLLAARDRAILLPDRTLHRQVWKTAGSPGVVLADGQFAGLWRSQKKGRRLQITLQAFIPLSAAVRAQIEAEAAALAPLKTCTGAEVAFKSPAVPRNDA